LIIKSYSVNELLSVACAAGPKCEHKDYVTTPSVHSTLI
jgi:hypothetical protein